LFQAPKKKHEQTQIGKKPYGHGKCPMIGMNELKLETNSVNVSSVQKASPIAVGFKNRQKVSPVITMYVKAS
jgi:hypothetical protein